MVDVKTAIVLTRLKNYTGHYGEMRIQFVLPGSTDRKGLYGRGLVWAGLDECSYPGVEVNVVVSFGHTFMDFSPEPPGPGQLWVS